MNIENIDKAIAIMERAKARDSVFMVTFQSPKDGITFAETEEELHACGNTACFAGHIAISPEWLRTSGHYAVDGRPRTPSSPGRPEHAIAEWLGIHIDVAESFIYGTPLPSSGKVFDVDWPCVKAGHVVKQLTLLRDLGEAEFINSKRQNIPA